MVHIPFLKPLILVIFLYIGIAFLPLYYLPWALEAEVICIKCKLGGIKLLLVTMLFAFHVFIMQSRDCCNVQQGLDLFPCANALTCFHVRIPSPVQFKRLVKKSITAFSFQEFVCWKGYRCTSQNSEIYGAYFWAAFEAFVYSMSVFLRQLFKTLTNLQWYLCESKKHKAQARKHTHEAGTLLVCEQASSSLL